MALSFTQLIDVLANRGPDLDAACIAIGMLIERERTNRPVQGDDGGVRQVLGDECVDVKVSPDDVRSAIDQLIDYIHTAAPPTSGAVWALAKSYDPEVISVLIPVLHTAASDPEQYVVALNALHGIEDCGVPSNRRDEAIEAIRRVASEGSEEIRQQARKYLEHYERVTKNE